MSFDFTDITDMSFATMAGNVASYAGDVMNKYGDMSLKDIAGNIKNFVSNAADKYGDMSLRDIASSAYDRINDISQMSMSDIANSVKERIPLIGSAAQAFEEHSESNDRTINNFSDMFDAFRDKISDKFDLDLSLDNLVSEQDVGVTVSGKIDAVQNFLEDVLQKDDDLTAEDSMEIEMA